MEGGEKRRADPFLRGRCEHSKPRGGGSPSRRRGRHRRCRECLGQRFRSDGCQPDYDPDFGLSDNEILEDITGSSDEEIVSRRKKVLDDALFSFFKKEAVKSLKRDFSTFCKEAAIWTENKTPKDHLVGREVFTMYSTKYYAEILRKMSTHQKDVVINFGFECLLKFQKTETPSCFTQWLAGCVDTVSSQIIVADEKVIPISKESVHYVMGLPNYGRSAAQDNEGGRALILSRFNLSEMPHITFFGNKLKSGEPMSDKEIFTCFMIVAMSCFLFPSAEGGVHAGYAHLLGDPSAVRGVDMCLLVYEWVVNGINKFIISIKESGRKPKVFGFCAYFLAVHYLDHLDFGVRVVEESIPRVIAWKGNLIRYFSELDRKRKNVYGKRQLKKALCRYPKEVTLDEKLFEEKHEMRLHPIKADFKDKMHASFSMSLPACIIDGIIGIGHCGNPGETVVFKEPEALLHEVLQFLSAENVNAKLRHDNKLKVAQHALNNVKDKLTTETEVGPSNSTRGTSSIVGNVQICNEKSSKVNMVEGQIVAPTRENRCTNIVKDAEHAPNIVKDKLITEMKVGPSNSSRGTSSFVGNVQICNEKSSKVNMVEGQIVAPTRENREPATPDCVLTKAVEPRTAPGIPITKKVRARVTHNVNQEQELSLLNTHPAGVKDRGSFFKYNPQHDKFFSQSTSVNADPNQSTKVAFTPFHAEQNNYIMINNMSPLGRTNLAQHFDNKESGVISTLHLTTQLVGKTPKPMAPMGSKQEPIPIPDNSPKCQVENQGNNQTLSALRGADRQSELAKNTDVLYNDLLHCGLSQQQLTRQRTTVPILPTGKDIPYIVIDDNEQDVAADIESNDSLVVIRPKKTIRLPISSNERFPVSEQEAKHYNSIIELSFTKRVQKRYALIYPRVHCNFISLGQSLMPDGHIDNFLVPCFCRKLFEDCYPSRSGRHYFFPQIGEKILNYKESDGIKTIATSFLGAATASKKKRLDLSDRLLFPLVIGAHWIVFSVDFEHGLFAFMDSYYDKDSNFQLSIRDRLIENFIQLWELIFNTREHNFRSFKKMYPHVPRQQNTNDCGVFAMKIMEVWTPLVDLRRSFRRKTSRT